MCAIVDPRSVIRDCTESGLAPGGQTDLNWGHLGHVLGGDALRKLLRS